MSDQSDSLSNSSFEQWDDDFGNSLSSNESDNDVSIGSAHSETNLAQDLSSEGVDEQKEDEKAQATVINADAAHQTNHPELTLQGSEEGQEPSEVLAVISMKCLCGSAPVSPSPVGLSQAGSQTADRNVSPSPPPSESPLAWEEKSNHTIQNELQKKTSDEILGEVKATPVEVAATEQKMSDMIQKLNGRGKRELDYHVKLAKLAEIKAKYDILNAKYTQKLANFKQGRMTRAEFFQTRIYKELMEDQIELMAAYEFLQREHTALCNEYQHLSADHQMRVQAREGQHQLNKSNLTAPAAVGLEAVTDKSVLVDLLKQTEVLAQANIRALNAKLANEASKRRDAESRILTFEAEVRWLQEETQRMMKEKDGIITSQQATIRELSSIIAELLKEKLKESISSELKSTEDSSSRRIPSKTVLPWMTYSIPFNVPEAAPPATSTTSVRPEWYNPFHSHSISEVKTSPESKPFTTSSIWRKWKKRNELSSDSSVTRLTEPGTTPLETKKVEEEKEKAELHNDCTITSKTASTVSSKPSSESQNAVLAITPVQTTTSTDLQSSLVSKTLSNEIKAESTKLEHKTAEPEPTPDVQEPTMNSVIPEPVSAVHEPTMNSTTTALAQNKPSQAMSSSPQPKLPQIVPEALARKTILEERRQKIRALYDSNRQFLMKNARCPKKNSTLDVPESGEPEPVTILEQRRRKMKSNSEVNKKSEKKSTGSTSDQPKSTTEDSNTAEKTNTGRSSITMPSAENVFICIYVGMMISVLLVLLFGGFIPAILQHF